MALNTSNKTIEHDKPLFKASNPTELAAQAIRHGMKWTIFRPEHNVFLAEGNGYIVRPSKFPNTPAPTESPPSQRTSFNFEIIPDPKTSLKWTIFRPEHNVFLAEGNGYILRPSKPTNPPNPTQSPPSKQPSLSFEIIRDPKTTSQTPNTLYIPTPQIDALFFGILPGYKPLHLPNYNIGTTDAVYNTMTRLDPSGSATKKIRDNRHPNFAPECLFGFSDIIPLAAPMFRQLGSTVIRLPIPAEYVVGLLTHKEGFVVFRHRLTEMVASKKTPVPEMVVWVQNTYMDLRKGFLEWEDEVLANNQINNRSLEFLDACHDAWDSCTVFLEGLETRFGKGFYEDLMASHLKNAVNYWHQAWNRMREGKARDDYGLRDFIAEGMHLYWDYMEQDLIFGEMKEREWDVSKEEVREAWVVMVFRGFCWWRCHWMMEGQDMCVAPERVASEYFVEMGDLGEWGKGRKEKTESQNEDDKENEKKDKKDENKDEKEDEKEEEFVLVGGK